MINTTHKRKHLRLASAITCAIFGLFQPIVTLAAGTNDNNTTTPIKHVIIVVGENRTFDHVFATYKPRTGTISNLLSKGIINADGTPGPNFPLAAQYSASDTTTFSINPTNKQAYAKLPPPKTGGTPTTASDTNPPPFASLAGITNASNLYNAGNLPYVLQSDLGLLTTGASGLPTGVVDTRILNVNNLPNGPFQLTPGVSYGAYEASPLHRFYQMWQQADCSKNYATTGNPSGCKNDLFAWVEDTVPSNGNGAALPAGGFVSKEGSTALGFYNVQKGDMPYFKSLADQYTIADNYHQPVMGGTGANSIMLGTADPIWFSDGNGNPLTPPSNKIENPNPQPGTNNFYTQDGYGGANGGGSYSNCSDTSQPGVAPIVNYLNTLGVSPNCQTNRYYLLNNYDPGYYGDGSVDSASNTTWGISNGGFVIPPSSVPTLGEKLSANQVSWAYYGEGWNAYKANPNAPNNIYCNICNPFQYSTAVMTNPTLRANLKDTSDFDNDVANNTLPAVSYVKPGGLLDGHPTSSKYNLFEAFTKRLIQKVQSNPSLWASTAILITNDEGGGYYDSGYIQPLDFFGDGTRIPLIVVSPYAVGGRVVHTYYDHVSFIKFVEANWKLSPLSSRSRDNLPNPVIPKTRSANPYTPTNSPAIGNLMNMFQFLSQPAD